METISDENGVVLEKLSFDPWVGRMLSPDPFIQDPPNTQNYNRCSYALNNPLKYTDPIGYHHTSVFKPGDWNAGFSSGGALHINIWFTNDFNHNPFGNYEQSHTYSYDNFTGTWSNGAGQQVSPLEVHANKTWSNEEFNNFVDENSTFYNFTAEYVDSNNGGVEYTNKMVDIYPSSFDLGGMEVVASQLSVLITLGVAQNGSAGGGDLNAGHVNWFLGSTAGILGGQNGIKGSLSILNGLQAESNALKLGLNYSRQINLVSKIGTGIKWFGRSSAAFSVLYSGSQFLSGQISGGKFGLDATITGASFIPVVGPAIGLQYFIIDNTIGVGNFSNMMINQEIQRSNMINNGNWGMGFYPHVGMGVR